MTINRMEKGRAKLINGMGNNVWYMTHNVPGKCGLLMTISLCTHQDILYTYDRHAGAQQRYHRHMVLIDMMHHPRTLREHEKQSTLPRRDHAYIIWAK